MRIEEAENSPIPIGSMAGRPATGDVGGDRRPDLLASHDDVGRIALLIYKTDRTDGKGGFAEVEGLALESHDRPDYVIANDLDKGGRADLVVSNYGSGDLTIFLARATRE